MKINLKKALNFVHEREHYERGFTLYKGVPDTKNTYYGVKILEMFKEEPNNIKKTINWVQKLQNDRMYGIQGVFYRLNILNIFNKEIKVPDEYIEKLNAKTKFSSQKAAYYYTVISNILKLDNLNNIADWILSNQNNDGAFGSGYGLGRSEIISTYYALESLNYIDPSIIEKKDQINNFAQRCITKEGGFTFIPNIYPPYLEPTYAGVRIQEILNINNRSKNLFNLLKNYKIIMVDIRDIFVFCLLVWLWMDIHQIISN
jgi:hypothetical protein